MSYLRTFLPWIVFAVVPSSQWQWAASAGLVAAAVLALLADGGSGHSTASLTVRVAGFAVPTAFTVRHVAAVRARAPRS
ncbi:hypothetical protein ACFC6L_36335 [Kitasatospora phosalacinea]|uniref:hypothetical protein n=1 Tax=Kitasatospora phosalacinea TaxID=2065 RepID=UPI0035E342B8